MPAIDHQERVAFSRPLRSASGPCAVSRPSPVPGLLPMVGAGAALLFVFMAGPQLRAFELFASSPAPPVPLAKSPHVTGPAVPTHRPFPTAALPRDVPPPAAASTGRAAQAQPSVARA
eukprot:CAMPEP_0174330798 /NCGR_PEP_ID=MMETSP0810-20121108/16950_1 /TAXON_ID=73025 ORGANISM="Eutreptiella gymnastica-like, Strain CCMP1594" /NCGR_SAMPLE_ID=MMETSP0810 /ASSEMBLY_ACC=CAM_ASM_000659 /LENGTH=117 /DNA_ID=CAMNT_0015446151 /DNA_START=33 /DNA_END=382 /DNA_ORIENTATION=+